MATLIEAVAEVNKANFAFERWQYTLLMLAFLLVAIVFNTWGAKALPRIETLCLFGHLGGLLVVGIPLLVLAPKNSAGHIFTEVANSGGWSNVGTSCLVAQVPVQTRGSGQQTSAARVHD